jgi:hypothetical protein
MRHELHVSSACRIVPAGRGTAVHDRAGRRRFRGSRQLRPRAVEREHRASSALERGAARHRLRIGRRHHVGRAFELAAEHRRAVVCGAWAESPGRDRQRLRRNLDLGSVQRRRDRFTAGVVADSAALHHDLPNVAHDDRHAAAMVGARLRQSSQLHHQRIDEAHVRSAGTSTAARPSPRVGAFPPPRTRAGRPSPATARPGVVYAPRRTKPQWMLLRSAAREIPSTRTC